MKSSAERYWVGLMTVALAAVGSKGWAAETDEAKDASGRVVASTQVVSLDGPDWLLATDPGNVGRKEQWQQGPRPDARKASVPWILQGTFPGYHGVAWYWRQFTPPTLPHPGGRALLRFGAVDYLAEVWLNGQAVGGHECGETPFTLDVTHAIRPGVENLLAVRVLNPTHQPIDGITLNQTGRRAKVIPYSAGAAFNHGGICGPVDLVLAPDTRIENLFVVGDLDSGKVRVEATLRNAGHDDGRATVEFSIGQGSSGETIATAQVSRPLPLGDTTVKAELSVRDPRPWQPSDPSLYRLTARVRRDGSDRFDEISTRFGFRTFCFKDGCFRLNGRRIYLRSTHTCNHFPMIGQQFPADPDLVRRDLLNLKAMGFNAVRFIWGGATPEQLDYCDEIGLMVYEESYASAPLDDSPKMKERFDANVTELIRRDRNHPSVVMWGLLNESTNSPAFRHAVSMLPLVRKLDATRMVMLNSGRFDAPGFAGIGSVPGVRVWPKVHPSEPWVGINPTTQTIRALGITWPPGRLAFHPGPANEFSAMRWTAPAAGQYGVSATFTGFAERATTDVHVLHNGKALFDGLINLGQSGNEAAFSRSIAIGQGDTIDFVVGSGNGKLRRRHDRRVGHDSRERRQSL